ncbi:MAG: class B sortase [Ndongobacter sp.]|nr:class B sortase [Ndongobacter sp.]
MKKKVYLAVQIVLLCVIVYCAFRIGSYLWARMSSDRKFEDVQKVVDSYRPEESETAEPATEATPTRVNYTEMMAQLKSINTDLVAYLDIDGTQTHYPIAHLDNWFYLDHGVDKEENIQGVPFLDENNRADFTDQNSVVYAHMMYGGDAMFAGLKHFLEQDYVDQSPKTFTITNEAGVHHYRIFSAFRVPADEDYRTPNVSEEAWLDYLNATYERSFVSFGERPDFDAADRIVTFSTCTPERDYSMRIAVVGIYEFTQTEKADQ